MAVTVTKIADGEDVVDNPTLSTGATVTASVGNWLVVVLAVSNDGPGGTSNFINIVDSDGINTYTTRAHVTYTQLGALGDGAVLVFSTCAVTDALTNAVITANFDGDAHNKAITVYRISGATPSFVAADTTGSGSGTTSHSAATVSVANGNIIFGAASIETNDSITGDSDTTNGSWSAAQVGVADAGFDVGSQTVVSQYKVVTGTGNQSWACSTTSSRDSVRSYLVLGIPGAAFSIAANQGSYALSGTVATLRKSKAPLAAAAGSYALTGTAATFINSGVNKSIVAAAGSYALTGTDATLTHGYKLDATAAGSYALTGTDATLRRALPMVADAGSYNLLGTDATLTKASLTNKVLTVDSGIYALTGTNAALRIAFKLTVDSGSYALTGSAVALVTAANKVLLAEAGSYALVGTDAGLSLGVVTPSVSPLHIGEWPVDKRRRSERARALEQQRKARDRLKRAIGRLLEGLPPEFDEPEQLAQAEDNAIQAFNLLRAMQAPWQELNAVNELIDHIRQLRIAQPIVQLQLARAYNQAHRHLQRKAAEDVAMTLLLGD